MRSAQSTHAVRGGTPGALASFTLLTAQVFVGTSCVGWVGWDSCRGPALVQQRPQQPTWFGLHPIVQSSQRAPQLGNGHASAWEHCQVDYMQLNTLPPCRCP